MKKIIALLALSQILYFLPAVAQKEPVDEKAKAILDELSKKTKAYTSIKAEFSYTLDNPQEKVTETQKGSIALKGNKYKLSIAGQEIVCDGKTLWTYMKDVGEVQIDNAPDPNKEDNTFSPTTIFTVYEKGFKFKFDKEETKNGKVMQIINLYPIKANEKPYHTVKLFVDKNVREITSVIVLNKDGNKYTYNLTKFETNLPMSDSDFVFDTSKAKEVIDLR
jgi:outer membrane lipoprotein carrier protein